MSSSNFESHKKSGSVLEKLGQKISNLKEDIVDNLERRRQSHSSSHASQSRLSMTDDSSFIEKKPPTPPESHLRRTSGKNRKENIHIR